MPSVGIVIVNYNGAELLPACLDALRRQTVAPDEIVVADNGSSDGSLPLLHAEHPDVRTVEIGRNTGFAGGANRGVAATGTEWVCVLNSDAEPAPDWLERLFAAPRTDAVWSLGSVLLHMDGERIESAGDQYHPDGFAYKLLREEPVTALPGAPYPVFAAPGAAPVFRRDVFDALGGYEERFFLYYEDVDLAFRAVLRGHHALLVPDARVRHRLGATTRSLSRVRFYAARNSLWTAVRCLPDPQPIVRQAVAEVRAHRPRKLLGHELSGRAAGLKGLPWAWRTRREIQAGRTVDDAALQTLLAEPTALTRPAS